MRASGRVTGAGNCGIEIQFTDVIGNRFLTGKVQTQIAEWLIRRHTPRGSVHGFVRERLSFLWLAREEQATDLCQIARTVGIVAVTSLAGPDRILVNLNPFIFDSAKHHRRQSSVTNWQCFVPLRCWLSIPQS